MGNMDMGDGEGYTEMDNPATRYVHGCNEPADRCMHKYDNPAARCAHVKDN